MNQTKEEKWNAISHAVGIPLGIIGGFMLLAKNGNKSTYALLSILIYILSVVLLFAASTLYHAVSKPELKKKLRILDHISIYILIAGTYTPVCLITLNDKNGWLIFYAVWAIAGIGTILKLFFTGKFEIVSLLLYLVMGWLVVFDFENLLDKMPTVALQFLLLGGIFYTVGTVFYGIKKIPFNHFIWHLFVLGGAMSHGLLVYSIV